MKCIKCGAELETILDFNRDLQLLGYKCVNVDCEIYNEQWLISEHKDNQDWNVRHTRALEAELAQMRTDFDALLQKLGV